MIAFVLVLLAALPAIVRAHLSAFAKGMYCQNGLSNNYIYGTAEPALPLFNMTRSQWWMHGKCINYPPPEGEFLDLPAGGSTTVEIAHNKAFTTMNYDKIGNKTSNWADGLPHPELESSKVANRVTGPCVHVPNIHTVSQVTAAGTAFAIAYKSDIHQVKLEDLTVFTVRYHTPWKRFTSYDIPKQMPACPKGGCICAWGWIPNGCGIANMYMVPFRCRVTNASPNAPKLAKAVVPKFCEDDASKCVKGAKQFMVWNQREGNNINVDRSRVQKDGMHRFAGYNMKMGFKNGAQNDIFVPGSSNNATTSKPVTSNPQPSKTVTVTASPHAATVTKYATKTVTHTVTQVVETQFLHASAAEHYIDDPEAGAKLGISCRRVREL
jgi:hypothetical protein